MKSSIEKVSSLERKLNVEVPAAVVTSTFEKMYKGVQKQATIKGFRQGKAPIATIKSVYGDRIKQDVVQDLVQKHYYEAIREHKIEPISYPDFEFDAPQEGKEFTFTAKIEVRPEVELKDYEGLELQKEKLEIQDEKIENVINNILSARAELVDVLETRPAKKGDIAVIDFEGFVDGKPLENGNGKSHHLELGTNSFIEGFEEGIEGMSIGATKTLNLHFPNPYHAAELAGKPVEFKVVLSGIKKKSLPELTDDFVANMMGSATGSEKHTVASLKKTIHDDIEQSEKKRIETDLKNRILRTLAQKNPVEVPPSMLKNQIEALVEDTKKRMMEQGMSDAQFEDYQTKWSKDFEKTAREMIQSGFLVDAIARKHDLVWTNEDLNSKFEEYAKQTGIELSRIKEFYSRPEQTDRVTYMITEDKVLNFLMSKAKIKEVSKAALKD